MNITLSADEETIAKSRRYAEKHGTSLNNMVRDYLKRISGESDGATNAEEFALLARSMPGCSEPGYQFDREEIHNRDPRT